MEQVISLVERLHQARSRSQASKLTSGRVEVLSPWRAIHLNTPYCGSCHGRVQARGERQCQHRRVLGRVEDAVVPQAGGGVVGAALVFVLVQDRRV